MRARNLTLFLGGSSLAAVALLLAGCGQGASNPAASGTPTAEAATTASDTNEPSGSSYVVDEVAAPAATNVVAVPPAPKVGDSTAVAPLIDAAAIARSIDDRYGIERVRHGDGWAWVQHGNIIRTASADGKQVAYFRNGSQNPFFIQNGDHAYSYVGDSVAHAYDRGKPEKVDPNDRAAGDKLAGKARDDRKDAEHVAETHRRPTPTPSPSPTPTPTHGTPDHSSRNDRHGGDASHGHGATPSPTPTPAPSPTRRRGHDRGSD